VNETASGRSWPALDVHPASESLQAALLDYDVTAVHERAADEWRIYFSTVAERDRAAATLPAEFPDLAIRPADIPDENWAARSQASLHAIRVGNIVVAPPWDVPAEDSLAIIIQPSMGFGTGHHATTRLCLAALQRLELGGRTVIDVGTGSGVLAIAASLLGAGRAVGIDDDADAINAAEENLGLNPQAEVNLLVADMRYADLGAADIVMANLTGGLLISAARRLQDMVAEGGRLILSGLMSAEEHDVLAAFTPWRMEDRSEEDEWICVTLRLGEMS